MALNLLTVRKIETAQSEAKPYLFRDGGSLFLRVQPNGSELWWYRYRLGKSARSTRSASSRGDSGDRQEGTRLARSQVREGRRDPTLEKRVKVAAQVEQNDHTFKAVARGWMASNTHWSDYNAGQVKTYLEKDVFPALGKLPIGAIKASHLRTIIQGEVERGAPTVANLIKQWSGQIFGFASGVGLATTIRPRC